MKVSSRVRDVIESATTRLNAEAKALVRKGIHVYNLSAGELDVPTFASVQKGVRAYLAHNKYTPVNGLPELRDAIVRDVKKKYRIPVTTDNIAVTAGAKQALYHALAIICEPGDEVIIPTPAWVSYEHMVRLVGAVPIFVPLTGTYDLDVSAVKTAVTPRTRAIIVNSPHNPTGALFSNTALAEISTLARKRKLFLIADDIYHTLLYGRGYVPLTRHIGLADRLIIVNGFSKSHAMTGWRVGYMVAHPDIIEANNRFQGHTSGNAATLSQWGALAGLTDAGHETIHAGLAEKKALAETLLRRIPDVSYVPPKGAFYIFADIHAYATDTVTLCERLLAEERVVVVPGEAFRAPGFIRISFSGNARNLREGLTRLRRFLSTIKK